MASPTIDAAEDAAIAVRAVPGLQEAAASMRPLLDRLERTSLAKPRADGTVGADRSDPGGCILYGPYWHLETGRFRLVFRARAEKLLFADQPVLGIEIIVLSRFQRAWRDFTAAELAAGPGELVFDVPPEFAVDGGNEARFEFRFFHFGNAEVLVEALDLERLPDGAETVPHARHWRLLGRLRHTWLARRVASGSISVKQGWRAGDLLFGGWPYLRLGKGRYRLTIGGRSGPPRAPAQPMLGVEILGRSRWYSDAPFYLKARLPKPGGTREAWADFLAEEWQEGTLSFDFAVPAEIATESGTDAPFDIRLLHLGNADLTIDSIDLLWLGDGEADPQESTWRLLGRLRKARIGSETPAGTSVLANEVPGKWLTGPSPGLSLPPGRYRLSLRGTGAPVETPAVLAEVARMPAAGIVGWMERPVSAFSAELSAGDATAEFEVPLPSSDEGGDRRFRLSLSHLGTADVALEAIDLTRIPDAGSDRTSTRLAGRKKLVLIGNCQCSVLVQAFNQADSLSRQFATKYHFVQLRPNLYEFARRDIEDCDVLLVQDIDLWNHFPLRDCVPAHVDVVKFPLVRFASLWPFDGWNGPGDREAHGSEAPNTTFPFFDGLLGRLRHEIPDKEARLRAYRTLEVAGVVNYRRMHALEERRLLKVDKEYDCTIGEFTLENFRTRQVFHTTVRPNWQGFNLLIRMILKSIGVTITIDPLAAHANSYLRIPQVPVHPKVAEDLGVKWADERTQYQAFGREMSWEAYIRRYIAHYG